MAGHLARSVVAVAAIWRPAAAATGGATTRLMKGISYGPTPVLQPAEASRLPEDDFFCDEAAPMWSSEGRGDLRVMKALGANLVRLYGNDPRNNHSKFLEEADKLDLEVAPGMSDWPYYQKQPNATTADPGSCRMTGYNCFSQVKPLYMDNLAHGFLTKSRTYQPSLRVMNILNEADLKMPPTATNGGRGGVVEMCRALVSAFDAMLDAEKDSGVTGPLINFTATFSFAVCASCDRFQMLPALGQMAQLDDAMKHPEAYGYTPKNDVAEAYRTRWMHSFNTANPAEHLETLFFKYYNDAFPTTPVYIGEYHAVHEDDKKADLDEALSLAKSNPLFAGISFFEFTVSYYKTGTEMDFGIFGYGDAVHSSMDYFGKVYPIRCLTPTVRGRQGPPLARQVALAYGGSVETLYMCPMPGREAAEAAPAADRPQQPALRGAIVYP